MIRWCYILFMALLTGLYGFRVAGQYVQRTVPVTWLPAAHLWQDGGMSYSYASPLQIAVLLFMVISTFRAARHAIVPRRWKRRLAHLIGWVYLAVTVVRMVPGISIPPTYAWLETSFALFFHLVVAIYMIALAVYLDYDATRRKEHYYQAYGTPD